MRFFCFRLLLFVLLVVTTPLRATEPLPGVEDADSPFAVLRREGAKAAKDRDPEAVDDATAAIVGQGAATVPDVLALYDGEYRAPNPADRVLRTLKKNCAAPCTELPRALREAPASVNADRAALYRELFAGPATWPAVTALAQTKVRETAERLKTTFDRVLFLLGPEGRRMLLRKQKEIDQAKVALFQAETPEEIRRGVTDIQEKGEFMRSLVVRGLRPYAGESTKFEKDESEVSLGDKQGKLKYPETYRIGFKHGAAEYWLTLKSGEPGMRLTTRPGDPEGLFRAVLGESEWDSLPDGRAAAGLAIAGRVALAWAGHNAFEVEAAVDGPTGEPTTAFLDASVALSAALEQRFQLKRARPRPGDELVATITIPVAHPDVDPSIRVPASSD